MASAWDPERDSLPSIEGDTGSHTSSQRNLIRSSPEGSFYPPPSSPNTIHQLKNTIRVKRPNTEQSGTSGDEYLRSVGGNSLRVSTMQSNMPRRFVRQDSMDSTSSTTSESIPVTPNGTPVPVIHKPQSLEGLVSLFSAVGLEDFQQIWEEDEEVDVEEFSNEAFLVLKEFALRHSTFDKDFEEYAWLKANLNEQDPAYQHHFNKLKAQLESLFNRIDANGNLLLDWDEFASFFLLGLEGERKMKLLDLDNKCYSIAESKRTSEKDRKYFHKEKIKRTVVDEEHSTYYTLSEHGQLKRWIYVKSTQSLVFLSNMSAMSTRVLDLQIYRKWVVTSDIARRIRFFDRVSGELKMALVGRNSNKYLSKTRNHFENQNFVGNIRRQLLAESSKTQGVEKSLEKMKNLSKRDESADDIVSYKRTMKRKSYLESYKKKLFGKKHVNMKSNVGKSHRVYILEGLGQRGGIPMSFQITQYRENDYDYHIPYKHILVIGTDGGVLKSYDISRIFLEDESIINKHKSELTFHQLTATDHSHRGWVTNIRTDHKEKLVMSGSWDGQIKVWSLFELNYLRTLNGHKKPISCMIYDPKMQMLATCARERELYLWKPHSTSHIDVFVQDSPILDIAFNKQEGQIISLSTDQLIKVWDLTMYKCTQTIPAHLEYTSINLTCISVDQNRNCLVTGNFSNGYSKLLSWEMKKNFHEESKEFMGHKGTIVKVLWNERYKEVVSCDQHSVAVWNCFDGKLIFKFHVDDGEIVDMCFDHLKRRIVVSFDSFKYVHVYNFYNGQLLKKLRNVSSEKEVCNQWFVNLETQHEKSVIAGTGSGHVLKWNDTEDLTEPIRMRYEKANVAVSSILLVPPDNLIVGYEDGALWLMSFVQGKARIKKPFVPHRGKIPMLRRETSCIEVSPSAQSRRRARYTSQSPSSQSSNTQDHRKQNLQIEQMVFLHKKKPIVISCQGNGLITFFSALDLKILFRFRGTTSPNDSITCLSIDSSNNTLITGDSQGYITIYDISNIEDPKKRHKQQPNVHQGNIIFKTKFRAYDTNGIHSLVYADMINVIIVGGGEKYVSAYSTSGRIIGIFGQKGLWDLGKPNTWGSEHMVGVSDKHGYGVGDLDEENEEDSDMDSVCSSMSSIGNRRRSAHRISSSASDGRLNSSHSHRNTSNSSIFNNSNRSNINNKVHLTPKPSPLTRDEPTHTDIIPSTCSDDDIISLNDLPASRTQQSSLMQTVSKNMLSPIRDMRHDHMYDSNISQNSITNPDNNYTNHDDFDTLSDILQSQIHSKRRLLKKPSLPSIKKHSTSHTASPHQQHMERSKDVFENAFLKGKSYEERLHSYLQIEKGFVDPGLFGNWKNQQYWKIG